MGCICESKTKDGKIEADLLTLKSSRGQTTQADEDNKLSINQATFVTQKKFNQFLKEYDIYEYIGKGYKNLTQAPSVPCKKLSTKVLGNSEL
jgi:hypothetical protein